MGDGEIVTQSQLIPNPKKGGLIRSTCRIDNICLLASLRGMLFFTEYLYLNLFTIS